MRHVNIKGSVGLTGIATLKLANGQTYKQKNTVTNYGLSEVVYSLLDKSLPQFYFAVGDDDSNITPADISLQNALENELERLPPIQRRVEQDIDGNYRLRILSNFGGVTGSPLITNPPTTLREVGLFNRFKEGVMFARAQTEAPFNMDASSIYNGSWDIKVNVQDIETSGGIVQDGSKLVCNSLMKFDELINNEEQYYSNQLSNTTFTPHPWGINLVSLGASDAKNEITLTDLKIPQNNYDAPPTITRLDLTGESSDLNYEPKLIIQRYLKPNSIPFDIKEVGLFNQRFGRFYADSSTIQEVKTMFSRVVLDTPIPANSEAVLNWVIGFKRGV